MDYRLRCNIDLFFSHSAFVLPLNDPLIASLSRLDQVLRNLAAKQEDKFFISL